MFEEKQMNEALIAYSKLIDPWARRQAGKMLEKVSRANKRAMTKNSKEMGRLLKTTVAQADVGIAAAQMMHEQVELIKSIPLKAALRVQEITRGFIYEGKRADEVAQALAEQGKVSESTAMLIARTEVARANASINQARSQAVGSTHYRWRNSGDESVRLAHKKYHGKQLDGMVFSWDSPPHLDDGTVGHPGTFPNCRCFAEPYFPEE